MIALVIMKRVSGIEMWQVYTAAGFVSQHWSQDYAIAAAAKINAKVN